MSSFDPTTEKLIAKKVDQEVSRRFRSYVTGATLAFLMLTSAFIYVVFQQASDQHNTDVAFAKNRIEASSEGCASDKAAAVALRSAIGGQVQFIRKFNPPAPPTIDQRIQSIRDLQKRIIIPDCNARVAKAIELLRSADEDAADRMERKLRMANTRGD